jgi:parallel beta-helix repeat protein
MNVAHSLKFSTVLYSKYCLPALCILLVVGAAGLFIFASFAQGPLIPPGPPGPVMKTLNQVEPRTPISSLPFLIGSSGSYYVTTNLTGVDPEAANNSRFANLRAFTNGWESTSQAGLRVGEYSRITACVAEANQDYGIRASAGCMLSECTVRANGGTGIRGAVSTTVRECVAEYNGQHGISVAVGGTVSKCAVGDNGQHGVLVVGNACTVNNCTVWDNAGSAIHVNSQARVVDNTCSSNKKGVLTIGNDNRIEGNNVTRNIVGIEIAQTGNIIVRNTASGNTTNYNIVAGNTVGPITSNPTDFWPWANFEF